MIRDNREYRSFPLMERKKTENGEESYMVEGYASTFGEYELFQRDGESFCEIIDREAFKECDMSDVVFLLDHSGRVYARTKNGSVDLKSDEHGLFSVVDLSRSSSARSVYEDIMCGNYDQMSFAFTVVKDEISHDRESKKYLRTIKQIGKMFDVSAVAFPANPQTEIGISSRSCFDGFIEEEKRLELIKEEKQRKLDEAIQKFMEVK